MARSTPSSPSTRRNGCNGCNGSNGCNGCNGSTPSTRRKRAPWGRSCADAWAFPSCDNRSHWAYLPLEQEAFVIVCNISRPTASTHWREFDCVCSYRRSNHEPLSGSGTKRQSVWRTRDDNVHNNVKRDDTRHVCDRRHARRVSLSVTLTEDASSLEYCSTVVDVSQTATPPGTSVRYLAAGSSRVGVAFFREGRQGHQHHAPHGIIHAINHASRWR